MGALGARRRPRRARRPGFTLVEVLLAVFILTLAAGVILGVVLPAGAGTRARVDRAHAERAGASLLERLLAENFLLVPAGVFGPNPVPGHPGATAEIRVSDLTPRLKRLAVAVRVGGQEAVLECLKGNHAP